jgi:hypothetical protein
VAALYRFHVNVFSREDAGGFDVTWEDAAAMLERLPRMIFEPDGSFVISGGVGPARWQVDGHLFDFDGRLHRMELRGACPPDALDALFACVGWPPQPLAFEMVREGERVDEQEFRRQAADSTDTGSPRRPAH